MHRHTRPNIALLIDAENIGHKGIDAVLKTLGGLGDANIRRAYGNWTRLLTSWADVLQLHRIEPVQQFGVTKGKNASDMRMTIDAMDMLSGGRVHGFGIMSSDSDFMPLATRIRQDGVPVYAFGTSKTPEPYRQTCTCFFDVDELLGESTPKKKKKAQAVREFDEKLDQVLNKAFLAAKGDEREYAYLGVIGKHLGNGTQFKTRDYGHKCLSDLFRAAPNFTLERREPGGIIVRRKSVPR